MKRIVPARKKHKKRDATTHVGAGGVELVKRGASRYAFSDPYHIAIELSWKGFVFAFLGLELGINVIFALLYLASPGSVANMRPGDSSSASRRWRPWVTERWLRRRSTATLSRQSKSSAAWSLPRS